MDRVRIGTRGSALALAQASQVASLLRSRGIDSDPEQVVIRTSGDRIQDRSLAEIGGKGLFIKEIEEAMLEGAIDLAVHSMKDLPGRLATGLAISAVLPRERPRDALITRGDATAISDLPDGAVVGTSSLRRRSQCLSIRPDLRIIPLRGNVDTRLRKLDEGGYDLLVLATAGLIRLELANRITVRLPVELCMPAPGQGIVAIESRVGDEDTAGVLAGAGDAAALVVLTAERAYLTTLGGGCQVPVGGLATIDGDALAFRGVVAEPDGARLLRRRARGALDDPAALGDRVARELLADGADEILTAFGV